LAQINLGRSQDFSFDSPDTGTPQNERAPLFAHEAVEPYQGNPQECSHEDESAVTDDSEDIDINDPTIEKFPRDRPSILQQVRSAETRLGEDETRFECSPASPVLTPDALKHRNEPPQTPSPRLLESEQPPVLDVIPEEHDPEPAGVSTDPVKSDQIAKKAAENVEIHEISDDTTTSGVMTPEESSSDDKNPSVVEIAPGLSETVSSDSKQSAIDVAPGLSETVSPNHSKSDMGAIPDITTQPAIKTAAKAAAETPQANSYVPEKGNTAVSPAITVQPATPSSATTLDSSSPREIHPAKSKENTETTSISTNKPTEESSAKSSEPTGLKQRKPVQESNSSKSPAQTSNSGTDNQTKSIDRSRTPTSIRSTGKLSGENGGFLKIFWRTVFVGWIGGFLAKLCGGSWSGNKGIAKGEARGGGGGGKRERDA
jgi:hypothetical protein